MGHSAPRPPRRHIPLSVKLEACLILLGFPRERHRDIQWNHTPALGLRPVSADGKDYEPPQLDPAHLEPLLKGDHLTVTTGRRGESKLSISGNGDVSRIAKCDRLEADTVAFRQRMLARAGQAPDLEPDTKPRRRLQGRGFPKRPRPERPAPDKLPLPERRS